MNVMHDIKIIIQINFRHRCTYKNVQFAEFADRQFNNFLDIFFHCYVSLGNEDLKAQRSHTLQQIAHDDMYGVTMECSPERREG